MLWKNQRIGPGISWEEVRKMYINSIYPVGQAQLEGSSAAPGLTGTVRFYQHDGTVLVVAQVTGLPESNPSGFFALHIHEGDSCTGEDFAGTGGHFDPGKVPHPQHAGDLPPLLSCGGAAYLSVRTDRFRAEDVLGRTVVIHSGPDDFRTQPAGNAGTKIACGVIRRP